MLKRIASMTAVLCSAATAHAGGFELPDNGTEALGRGTAFVAKADDGTAIEYNPAGLARQGGLRITLDSNFIFHDLAFTRVGTYPGDPSNMNTPWGGQPYPTMHDGQSMFPVPFLAASIGLPVMKGLTIAAGLYGPNSIGSHNYGQTDTEKGATVKLANGMTAPAPSRYTLGQDNLLIVYPTLSVALRPVDWLSVGVSGQLVYANFDLENAAITNLGLSSCPSPEYPNCDSYSRIRTAGWTGAAIFGVLATPTPWLDLGASYRTAIDINTSGDVHAVPPPALPMPLGDDACTKRQGYSCFNATFTSHLPMWLRLGGRVIARRADGSEKADLELDLTWENWSSEVKDHVHLDNFALSPTLDADVLHNYRDTFGIRVGGAYNHPLAENMTLTGRLGFYFDSAATHFETTSIDFNTAARYAGTIGLGFTWKLLTVNAAYAYVYSPTRTVQDSTLVALSATNGNPDPTKHDPIDFVGNGTYAPAEQMLSVGITIKLDSVLARR